MGQIKPGCLAIIAMAARNPENRGALVECVSLYRAGEILPGHTGEFLKRPTPQWVVRGIGRKLLVDFDGWQDFTVARESVLRPLGDQPGNESFVVEARKSLPRSKHVKGDTIDARGEVHS